MQLLVGTRTASDINLAVQLLMIIALWIGFYFAHTKQIAKHRNVQTTVVIANIFLIAFVMATSFYSFVILGGTTGGTVAQLMMVHGLLGLLAELTGIYLVLRMRTQLIPPRFRVRNFKLVMRTLISLWTLIVVLGLGIYYFRYLAPKASASAPVSSLSHLQQAGGDIVIHADEMQAAAGRGNLAAAKRHAEHLINLIEGNTGADYGDVDHDGVVEDPGDGTGALTYLQQVREQAAQAGGSGTQVPTIADAVRNAMTLIIADAKIVAQSSEVQAITPQVSESNALAHQIDQGTNNSVSQIAQALNATGTRLSTTTLQNTPSAPNAVTINMADFEYVPKALTVQKGTTVIFVNMDAAKHTVTEDSGKFNSKDIQPGSNFTFTFNDAGTFPYHCEFHGDKGGVDMAGTIVVQ